MTKQFLIYEKKIGCNKTTIYNGLLKTYNLNSRKRPGRPRKDIERLKAKSCALFRTKKWQVSQRVDGTVSKDTAHRRIKERKNIV